MNMELFSFMVKISRMRPSIDFRIFMLTQEQMALSSCWKWLKIILESFSLKWYISLIEL